MSDLEIMTLLITFLFFFPQAEEQKRIERQKKEVDDIEKRFADSQTKMQEEEDRAREIRKQRAQDEKERQANILKNNQL